MLKFCSWRLGTLYLLLHLPGTPGLHAAAATPRPVDFNRDIRPILSDQCFKCHGPDDKARKAKLRLDLREEAVRPLGDGKTPIVPRNSATSEVMARIRSQDAGEQMPPPKTGKSLTPAQVESLRLWIDQGAVYQDHWAFQKIGKPVGPAVKNKRWPRNTVDEFILARLEAEGLKPTAEADKLVLLRRVCLDLTGLPPTVEESRAYLRDHSPHAYENLVDRLLDSPARGEHMAHFWLDLARYADTNGYQYDTERTMWRWRDWVIAAFNNNLPFDQFTIEQLAGDLLPGATLEQKLATGFNRNHPITIEGGVIDEEYRTEYVIDRVATTSTAWLGLTMGCARCHDHKYDPLSQKDFYQFFAFFNQVPEQGNSGFSPMISTPTASQSRQLQEMDAEIARKQSAFDARLAQLGLAQGTWESELKARPTPTWTILEPASFKSTGGTTLSLLPDHSLLAGGPNPEHDIYEIEAPVPTPPVVVVRLEALTHESLPGNGPGRYSNGNFVLGEFELEVISGAGAPMKVALASASADYSQNGYEIQKTIDGRLESGNGWAVDGPVRHASATAIFVLAQPLTIPAGSRLKVRLRQEALSSHGIGRVRLSVSGDATAGAPDTLAALAKKEPSTRSEAEAKTLRETFLQLAAPAEVRAQNTALTGLREKRKTFQAGIPSTMVMQDMEKHRDTFLLVRGQYDKHGDKVTAGVPARFGALAATTKPNRLDLARWLVDPSHPLTARVTVNRFWQQIFGVGLVKTTEDFGLQGEFPSHLELLDWLARDLIENRWDIKRLQRLLVTSAAYRQGVQASPALLERDPENRLLARGPRQRLAAEVIRDSALVASGLLVNTVGGPSVYPYQPPGLWNELNDRAGYSREYAAEKGPNLYRRSLYTFWKRTVPPPTMQLFDAPEREFCVARRSSTTTPLQALALLNDPQFVEAARKLAERMMQQGGAVLHSRLDFGSWAVLSRPVHPAEARVFQKLYEVSLREFRADPASAQKVLQVGDSPLNTALDPADFAATTQVARALLNLDEFISKN